MGLRKPKSLDTAYMHNCHLDPDLGLSLQLSLNDLMVCACSGNNIYGTLPPLTNFIAAYVRCCCRHISCRSLPCLMCSLLIMA